MTDQSIYTLTDIENIPLRIARDVYPFACPKTKLYFDMKFGDLIIANTFRGDEITALLGRTQLKFEGTRTNNILNGLMNNDPIEIERFNSFRNSHCYDDLQTGIFDPKNEE